MNRRDLEKKIQKLFDGKLKDEERAELGQTLREDKEALEVYYQTLLVDSALVRLTHAYRTMEDTEPIAKIAEKRSRFRSIEITLLAAAAVITIAVVSLNMISAKEDVPLLTTRAAPDTTFEITPPPGSDQTSSSTLVPGSSLRIKQGSMKLSFSSGATSIVQAPAHLTLQEENQIYFSKGRGWFEIPEDLDDFRVITPEFEVSSPGTKFGIFTHPDHNDEVHVLSGSVIAQNLNPLRTRKTVRAKQAMRGDPAGRFFEMEVDPEAFLRALPGSLPFVHFSFDSATETPLAASGNHPAASRMEATPLVANLSSHLIEGLSGSALALGGGKGTVSTNWSGISGNRPRSMSFWVRVPSGALETGEGKNRPVSIAHWGRHGSKDSGWWAVQMVRQEETDHLLVPRISFGRQRYSTSVPLDDNRWHHVAAVYSGLTREDGTPEVAIWVDGQSQALTLTYGAAGEPETPLEVDTDTRSAKARPLHIGGHPNSRKDTTNTATPADPIVIDELSIYEGAISQETIESLWRKHQSR